MIAKNKLTVCANPYDVLSALALEKAGYELAYITGCGAAGTSMGAPDIGLPTATEVISQAINTARAVDIPVVCDIDTGFGGPNNVWRTVTSQIQFID